jgi:hypothetical protein
VLHTTSCHAASLRLPAYACHRVSVIHAVESVPCYIPMLRLCLQRILEAPGHFLTATSYCGSSTTLDSCYFEPFSNCTLAKSGVTVEVRLSGAA